MDVSILRDGLLAFLAAVGMVGLAWTMAGILVRRGRPGTAAYIVLRAQGDGEGLDWAVYTACRMAAELGCCATVVLADCGLDEKGKARAETLRRANRCVTVLTPSQIEEFIT